MPGFDDSALRTNFFDCRATGTVHPLAGANTAPDVAALPLPGLRNSHRTSTMLRVRAVFSEVEGSVRLHYFLCKLEGTGLIPGQCTWLRQTLDEVLRLRESLHTELTGRASGKEKLPNIPRR